MPAGGRLSSDSIDDGVHGHRGTSDASWEDGMPKLTYVVGDGGETRSVDVGDSCSIGSLAGNTILLDASLGVSRRHCQLLKIQSGYEIADLGSTNGTIGNGDRIEVGKVTLTFDDGSGPAVEEEISLEGDLPSIPAAPKSTSSASDQCVLVHAGGDKDGQKVALDKQRVTFGRNAKNSVVLTDTGASGFHAEIAREGGAYVLRDLGSTNGTLVDGEPVSETALQHGARIRMGATRFVFVDPTVSDFEKAMAAVDDLGSEWGLLRAEMDMTRVQEARRSQAVMIALVLVVVIGGGAYVITHPNLFNANKQTLALIDGNKVEDFSFEEHQGAGWAKRPDSPTLARAADSKSDGNAKQGTNFFAVSRDGVNGTCAAAQSSRATAFTVSPGRPVEFGAQVRTAGGAMAGVRVVWLDKPDKDGREIGHNSTPLATSTDWQPVKGVAMPPEGTRAAQLELIDAAGGTAFFDDVFFVIGNGSAGGGQAKDGAITLTASADGQTTISRDNTKLLVDGAVIGGALRSDAVSSPQLRGDRSGSQSLEQGGGLTGKSSLIDPSTGQPAPFAFKVSSEGGRFVLVEGVLPGAEAAWVANLPDEFMSAGVGVRSEGNFVRAGEPRLFDKVQDVSFGGSHRFKVSKDEGCGPLKMALYKVGDAWEIGFGAADGKLKLRIDTDSNGLMSDIDKLKGEAVQAKAQRHFGVAISKLKQLGGYHPGGSAEAVAIETEWQQLETQGKDALEKLTKRVEGAAQFSDDSELRPALAEADALAKDYAENDVGKSAAALGEKVRDARAKIRLVVAERDAKPLLRKADDFMALKMPTLAKAFYGEIVQRFPGTDAAKKASEALAK
jgi:pSer/pThr/pTyr-binding forkhead associated (FHA) protein